MDTLPPLTIRTIRLSLDEIEMVMQALALPAMVALDSYALLARFQGMRQALQQGQTDTDAGTAQGWTRGE